MTIREQIEAYRPWNEQEENDRLELLRWIDTGAELWTRENGMAHWTASGWVTTPDKSRVLMAYHNLYDSWAWLGGHADGERDLLKVALKEVREESGLQSAVPLSEDIFSIEILPVFGHMKKGVYVPSHLHLNVTYLIAADPEETLRIRQDENQAVAWFAPEEAVRASSEEWFRERIYSKLVSKIAHS